MSFYDSVSGFDATNESPVSIISSVGGVSFINGTTGEISLDSSLDVLRGATG